MEEIECVSRQNEFILVEHVLDFFVGDVKPYAPLTHGLASPLNLPLTDVLYALMT